METDNTCSICMANEKSSLKCKTCRHSICVECFKKISEDTFDIYTKKMIMTYRCVICRQSHEYSYDDFDKNEVINLAHAHIQEYIMKQSNNVVKTKTVYINNGNNNDALVQRLRNQIKSYQETLALILPSIH